MFCLSFVLVAYVLFVFFQIMLASYSWKGFQQFSSINVYEVLDVMFKSRANSSIAYVRVIRKFLDWSKSRHFSMQLPFPLINVYEVLDVMFKSRANSSIAYVRVIRKFLDWSKSRHLSMQLPFPLSVVSIFLFKVQQSGACSSSLILVHAALKWLHSFVPSLDCNLLDSEFCRNIIESAKRQKSEPVMKRSLFPQKL